MSFQDDSPDEMNDEQVYGGQVLKARVIRPEDKPIRYQHNDKTYLLAPAHPMYNLIKEYGEYEDV